MTLRKIALVGAALGAIGALGGCVSLFPKADPVQLYRFGVDLPQVAAADLGTRGYNISRAPTVFTRSSSSDRILTMTGAEAAYIAGARWIAPAVQLFDEGASRAFDAAPGCARLETRGDAAASDARLRLEVRSFEVRYLDGPAAAPTAVVEAHASLTRSLDRQVILERAIRIEQRAADNRAAAIVEALDTASNKALSEITAAVNAQAATEGCGRTTRRTQ